MRVRRVLSSIFALLSAACAGPAPATAPKAPGISKTPPRPEDLAKGKAAREAAANVMDRDFLRAYAATRGFRLGMPGGARATPDGKAVLFLRATPPSSRQTLFELDLATGETRELLTPERLAKGPEELSAEERARRERMRVSASGFTAFDLDEAGEHVLVTLSGRLFAFARRTGDVHELPTGAAGKGGAVVDPHVSPDGKRVAYVRDSDVYATSVGADGREVAITRGGTELKTHGLAEFVAQEELDRHRGFWWSPDGSQILYEEADNAGVERLVISDPSRPEREPDRPYYPRPGKANATVRLGLVAASGAKGGGKTTWVDWDRARFPYVASVTWSRGAPATIFVLDRVQKNGLLLAVDGATGATRTLVEEKDAAWINLDKTAPKWLPDGSGFLWSTERSGTRILELRDAKGEVVRALAGPDAGYRALHHVDEKKRLAYFEGGAEPSESALYKVSLDGGAPSPVVRVEGGGVVSPSFVGSDAGLVVAAESSKTAPPRVVVRSLETGALVHVVPSLAKPPKPGRPVEIVTVGPDKIRVSITRPRDFDPARRYPVIDAAYAGPHHNVVVASALSTVHAQWMADATGAIVVGIDARGTMYRGREWERAIENRFGSVALDGHVAALKALGERFPEMDTARVGVYGWSYGGYFSAYAVLARPDVYKAAAAGAPPVDWRDYDTAYTERYLGLPDESDAGRRGDGGPVYEAASLLPLARKPAEPGSARPMLVLHGTADDNVFFFNSLKLVDALERAGRPYEFMPLAGMTHQIAEPVLAERVWIRVATFLRDHL